MLLVLRPSFLPFVHEQSRVNLLQTLDEHEDETIEQKTWIVWQFSR